jgi:phosphoribosyl 1,2-cyclic phosphodiesterase
MVDDTLQQPAPALRLCVLGSGSKGNAAVVEYAGHALLIDCGICKRDFFERCATLGIEPASIEAVLVTHEHTDHTKGLGVVLRGLAKNGVHPALFASDAARAASRDILSTCEYCDQLPLAPGAALAIAGMQVHVFGTSHDAADPLGFRFEADGDSLGFMTDTGVVTDQAHDALRGCRILAIEANHDETMLRTGDYPWALKQRISGDGGHLSNAQSATELERLLHQGLQQVVAMHVSENNNTFRLPVRVLSEVLARQGHPARVQVGLPRTPIAVE